MFQDLHVEIVRTEKERAIRDAKYRTEREARHATRDRGPGGRGGSGLYCSAVMIRGGTHEMGGGGDPRVTPIHLGPTAQGGGGGFTIPDGMSCVRWLRQASWGGLFFEFCFLRPSFGVGWCRYSLPMGSQASGGRCWCGTRRGEGGRVYSVCHPRVCRTGLRPHSTLVVWFSVI